MIKSILVAVFCLVLVSNFIDNAPLPKQARQPTLLISLDGFRADKLDLFLQENPDSYFNRFFVQQGVKADYLKPSFPTLTFPNHFTIVTGLYMESHGIVGNSLYDPDIGRKVNLLSDPSATDAMWWDKAEPIWLTAKKQGFKTASFFWTGSEVWTRHPDVFLRYSSTLNYLDRCEEVVSWFKKFQMDFVTLYFNEPDHTGHSYGPDSKEYMDKIYEVDDTIGYLLTLLVRENLLDKINILIVSDHGMAEMKKVTIIPSQYVSTSLINSTKTVYGIVSNIHPINENAKKQVYDGLKKAPNLRVYYKEELPKDLNFQSSDRIAPIVAIADEGYVMNTQTQTLTGNHGFDNNLVSMRAIFMARGPDFKQNHKIPAINNVDVYPLLCELIDVKCNPNNGTITKFLSGITFTPKNLD